MRHVGHVARIGEMRDTCSVGGCKTIMLLFWSKYSVHLNKFLELFNPGIRLLEWVSLHTLFVKWEFLIKVPLQFYIDERDMI